MSRILLTCGPWLAEAAGDLGGNLVRLEYSGRPLLRTPSQAPDPYLFGSPMLFPANRTCKGRFSFLGREYRLPINEPANQAHLHGLVHAQDFSLLGRTEREAAFLFENRSEAYPFSFRLTITYRVSEAGLVSRYRIENTDTAPFPLTFGLHTTFVEPALVSVPIKEEQEWDAHCVPSGRYLPPSGAAESLPDGICPHGVPLSGCYSAAGHTARIGGFLYRVSENFDHWVLYNGSGLEGFFCAEPQCGAVNGLNLEGGCRILPKGGTLEFFTELEKSTSP